MSDGRGRGRGAASRARRSSSRPTRSTGSARTPTGRRRRGARRAQGPRREEHAGRARSPPTSTTILDCRARAARPRRRRRARAPARAVHARPPEPGAALPAGSRASGRTRSASASRTCRRAAEAVVERGRRRRGDEREPPRRARSAAPRDVPPSFASASAAIVDAGELPGTPSTVLDLTGPEPVVLREGAVPARRRCESPRRRRRGLARLRSSDHVASDGAEPADGRVARPPNAGRA